VLAVLGERRCHWHSERSLLDFDVDAELPQRLMQAAIEIGDRDAICELKRAASAVVGAHDQRVVDEVEVDLKCRVVVMQPPGREAAHVDVEWGVPPLVARRRGREADLAHDLAVEVQRVLGRTPVGEVEFRQRHRASASSNVSVS
jgi:hypothetical protein